MQNAETVLDVLRERVNHGIAAGEPGDRKRSRRVREGGVGEGPIKGTSPTSYLDASSALVAGGKGYVARR